MNVMRDKYEASEIKERSPLDKFANLIDEIKPDIVSMENVP
jgi:site-specific DNA-cytosine methylase